MKSALEMKVLVGLYRYGSVEQQEICELFMNSPRKTVGIAVDRVRTKLAELEEAKAS